MIAITTNNSTNVNPVRDFGTVRKLRVKEAPHSLAKAAGGTKCPNHSLTKASRSAVIAMRPVRGMAVRSPDHGTRGQFARTEIRQRSAAKKCGFGATFGEASRAQRGFVDSCNYATISYGRVEKVQFGHTATA
jgi:hypothetical protein